MIHSVLIFNGEGVPRLTKFYTPVDVQTQGELLKQVYQLVHVRSSAQSSFLTPPELLKGIDDIKVIYRQYATLYFVFVVDDQESDLGILDLIQVFVQSLDRCFGNVCELDLVFGWQTLQTVLEEMVQGGMVVETSVSSIVDAVDRTNDESNTTSSFSPLTNATSALSAFARDGRFAWPGR